MLLTRSKIKIILSYWILSTQSPIGSYRQGHGQHSFSYVYLNKAVPFTCTCSRYYWISAVFCFEISVLKYSEAPVQPFPPNASKIYVPARFLNFQTWKIHKYFERKVSCIDMKSALLHGHTFGGHIGVAVDQDDVFLVGTIVTWFLLLLLMLLRRANMFHQILSRE